MLQLLVGVPILILLCWLPGAAITRFLFGAGGAPTTEKRERVFLAVITSVLLTGWIGFTLAEMGLFSVWLILGIEIVIVLALLAFAGGGIRNVPATAILWLGGVVGTTRNAVRRPSWQVIVLISLLLGGALLYSRPAEMIRGALDSGAYINAGVALGRNGAIVQRDVLMRQLKDPIRSGDGIPAEGREFLQPLSASRYVLDRLRMPAFYVLDKQDAQVLPQHYSFFPVWIALFYQLFGLWGALWASPFLTLLASAAIYFFTARIFSRTVGLLALGLLIIFPLQSWFARYPVSETPTQLLAFVFFFTFARFVTETRRLSALEGSNTADSVQTLAEGDEVEQVTKAARFFAVLSALAVAELAFTRPDFPAYVVPLPLFMLWWWWSGQWRREHTWFAVALLVLFAQWSLHFFFFTYGYTIDLYYNTIQKLRRDWPRILPLTYGGVLLLVALGLLRNRLIPLLSSLGGMVARLKPILLGALCAGVGAYLFYRYIYEPQILTPSSIWGAITSGTIPFDWQGYIGAPLREVEQTGKSNQEGLINTNSFILVRIGWYLSPLGMLLGSAGLVLALWRKLNAASAAFFISLAVLAIVFVGETFTVPTYPYTMRRFMPVVIPALLICSAYFLAWAGEKLRPRLAVRTVGWGLYAALALFFVYTSIPMLRHTEEQGAIDQLQSLVSRLPNPAKTVILFSNERDEPYIIATPLQYIYGYNVFSLNYPYGDTNMSVVDGVIRRWQQQGYDVYAILGTNGGKLDLPTRTQQAWSGGFAGAEASDGVLGAPSMELQPLANGASWTYDVPEFEQLLTQKPLNIQRSVLHWGVYHIVPSSEVPAPSWPLSLDIGGFDYQNMVAGFAEKECHQAADKTCDPAAGFWRWTFGNALVRLPWRATAGEGATLTMRLRAGPEQRPTPADLRIYINGEAEPFGQTQIAPGADFTEVTFKIPPQASDEILIRINSSTWQPLEAGVSYDARILGVQVDSITIGE